MTITNRELYETVTSFETERSLEDYLRALWTIARPHREGEMTADRVQELLVEALDAEPAAFHPDWYETYATYPEPLDEPFTDWENTILYQVTDLRRMDDAGMLEDENRYYGITSPSGSRWYNFDPRMYLECAVRGLVGGYEEDEVVVLIPDEDGDDDSPIFELEEFGWDDFTELLWFGQHFE